MSKIQKCFGCGRKFRVPREKVEFEIHRYMCEERQQLHPNGRKPNGKNKESNHRTA